MNSILKRFRNSIQDFLIIIIIIFSIPLLADVDKNVDQSQVKVREFKNYREIFFKNSQILIDKKTKNIFFSKNKASIKIDNHKKYKFYTFSKYSKNKKHLVFLKYPNSGKQLIGYFSKEKTKYFKNSDDKCFVGYKQMSSQIGNDKILDSIYGLNVDNLLDKKSCAQIDPTEIKKIQTLLRNQLEAKSSTLVKCFDSEIAQKIFDGDPFLRKNASEIFLRYLGLVNSIGSGEKPLNVKCSMSADESGKVASISESTDPMEISFSLKDKKFKLDGDATSIFDHELFHYGAQQFPVGTDVKCLDENYALLFEKVCSMTAANFEKEKIETGKEIFDRCLTKGGVIVQTTANGINKNTIGVGDLAVAVEAMPRQNLAEAKVVTESLQKTASPITFKQIENSDIEAIAANLPTTSGRSIASTTSDGEFHTIAASPQVRESLERVESALSSTASGVESALVSSLKSVNSAAAAIVGNKAQASPTSATTASSTYGPLTVAETIAETYFPKTAEESSILNNPKLANATYDEKTKYFASGGKVLPGTAGSTMASAGGSDTSTGAATNAGQGVTGTQAATGATRSIASVSETSGAVTDTPAAAVAVDQPAVRKPASAGASSGSGVGQAGSANASASGRLDNETLQRLTAFSEVKGTEYTKIRQNYRDENFRSQLDERGIGIYDVKGQPLWNFSPGSEVCFVDNGKSLTKVSCKK